MLTVGSLFAGVGGLELGLERAGGFRTVWQVEREADCRRVLARHWPAAERFPDVVAFSRVPRWRQRWGGVDVLVGGFPCQDLSVAGKRAGLKGERSGLWWHMRRAIRGLRPRVVVWENVPGLLSSDSGRDFARILDSLAECGYYGAWRVLDAQHFGVPQRRRRVFGVFAPGCAGAGLAAEILALAEGGRRHPAKGRPAGAGVAATIRSRAGGSRTTDLDGHGAYVTGSLTCNGDAHSGFRFGDGLAVSGTLIARMGKNGNANSDRQALAVVDFGGNRTSGPIDVATAVNACKTASGRQDFETETFVVNAAESCATQRHARPSDVARCLDQTGGFATNQGGTVVGFNWNQSGATALGMSLPGVPPVRTQGTIAAHQGMMVRRLMPVECCRLQGFPDDWVELDPPLSDSAKYRMLGNAVAVPCAEWIGRRILAAIHTPGPEAA